MWRVAATLTALQAVLAAAGKSIDNRRVQTEKWVFPRGQGNKWKKLLLFRSSFLNDC